MKANKSKRNRHTGRINAYKRRILEQGKLMTDSNGKEYRYIQSGVRTYQAPISQALPHLQETKSVPVYSIVRAHKLTA